MLWVEKYRPHRIEEVAGNPTAVEELKRWALDWERGRSGKPLLVWGPPGVGKGAALLALAETMGWEIVEMNAGDLRNRENVERVVGFASTSGGLFGVRKLIFIDDVDAIAGRTDRGGTGAINEVLKASQNPVALTASDFWDRSISTLRNNCSPVEFRRINSHSISEVLAKILKAEGVEAENGILARIAGMSNGDVRSAINDLQSVSEGKKRLEEADLAVLSNRDRHRSVWDAVRTLMKAQEYGEAEKVTWGLDVEPEMFMKWVEENVPLEYERREDLARAFLALSRADIFIGRIRARQYWGFLRYANILMTAGVALAKDAPYRKFVKYSFPNIIRRLSASKMERAKLSAIGAKIGARTHLSSSEAANLFLPLLKILMEEKERIPEIAHYFEFDAEDLAFILEKSEKQAERLLEKAEEKKKPAGKRKADGGVSKLEV